MLCVGEKKSSEIVAMAEHGTACVCPGCLAVKPVLWQRRLLPTSLLVGLGEPPAGWLSRGLYTCFSSL